MSKSRITIAFVAATLSIAVAGCDPPPDPWSHGDDWLIPAWSPDSDSDADADSDSDADDTESDTGVDTEGLVICDELPTECADVGVDEDAQFYGCCFGDTVYWCQDLGQDWLLVWKDCAALGLSCAYLAELDYLWCI